MTFCPKKSSSVWCHYGYFIASDDVRARTIPNRKHLSFLMFTILDWAASDMMPTMLHQPDVACFYS